MPLTTFGDCWRKVRLHAAHVPFGLVREWTQDAFATLHDRRPWAFATIETRLETLASRSLTVTFTASSTAITSAALFLATDVGRQIRVGTYPYYTIVAVPTSSTATLDLPYAGTGGALTAEILSAYQTMPSDFGAFLLVADLSNQRQIGYWYTPATLMAIDPTRTSSNATARALASVTVSPVPATRGQMRYEWWPAPTTAQSYPAFYRQRPPTLADTDALPGVLQQRPDVLHSGALMECARWPGTPQEKNPYFSMATYREFRDDFEKACAHLELRDDDQSQQTWQALPYHRWPVWDLRADTHLLRATDATLGDYAYPGGYY